MVSDIHVSCINLNGQDTLCLLTTISDHFTLQQTATFNTNILYVTEATATTQATPGTNV